MSEVASTDGSQTLLREEEDVPEQRGAHGTVSGTVINSICTVVGAGILSLPHAMYDASLGIGIISICVFAIVNMMSAWVLAIACERSQQFSMNAVVAYTLCGAPETELDKSVRDYGTVSAQGDEDVELQAAQTRADKFRGHMSVAVDLLVLGNYCVALIAYAQVVSEAMPKVIEDVFHTSNAATSKYLWLSIAAVIFFALTSLRKFAELAISSYIGFGTILFMLLCILIRYPAGAASVGITQEERDDVRWFDITSGFLQSFATLAMSYGYQPNVPPYYQELQNRRPSTFMKTILLSFPVICVSYLVAAVPGYLTFGSAINDSKAGGNIVNNYPTQDTLINVARFLLFGHFLTVFPVVSVLVRQSVHRLYLRARGQRARAEDPDEVNVTPRLTIIIEAFVVVGVAAILAAVVPGLSVVYAIGGALCSAVNCLTLPGIVGWHHCSELIEDEARGKDTSALLALPWTSMSVSPRVLRVWCVLFVVLGMVTTVGGLISTFQSM